MSVSDDFKNKEIKCDCGKLLAKQHADGKIYVWCKKCRKEIELKIKKKIRAFEP